MHEFVENSVSSPTSAGTVIFALAAPLINSFQQSAGVCPKQRFQPEITTYCHFCAGYTTFSLFSAKCTSLSKEQNSVISPRSARFIIFTLCTPLISDFYESARVCTNSAFSPRSACFVIFTLGTPLPSVFSKVHEFVQNSVFSPRSAGIVIFALCAPLFNSLQQSARVCPKQRFQPEITTYCHFCAGYTTFSLFSAKCTSLSKEQNSVISPRSARFIIFTLCTPLISDFYESARVCTNSAFSPRSACFVIFTLGTPLPSVFSKVHEFVQNSVFSPRSAGIVIFALCAPLFNSLQQSARVCPKQRFQPEISTFCHFCTGSNTFQLFSAKCTGLYKTAFSALDHHVLSF